MRPEDLLAWLRAQPFTPFRITLNSGRTYEIRHPEVVLLWRTTLVIGTPSEVEGVLDRMEMIGLMLIERIEPIGDMAGSLAAPERRTPPRDD